MIRRWLIIFCLFSGGGVFAQGLAPQSLFDSALDAADKGELRRAINLLQELEKHEKPTAAVYWNLGIWNAELLQHRDALAAWLKFRELQPENWRVAAKLIQSYQALGDLPKRDQERDQLFRLWRSKADPELSKELHYCREQFVVDKQRVMVFEIFEPSGSFAIFHVFYLVGVDGKAMSRYSLGSYDSTNRFLRETGELKTTERTYHLDYYGANVHRTYGFFDRAPPVYEELRVIVVKAIKGEVRPMSQSTFPQR